MSAEPRIDGFESLSAFNVVLSVGFLIVAHERCWFYWDAFSEADMFSGCQEVPVGDETYHIRALFVISRYTGTAAIILTSVQHL